MSQDAERSRPNIYRENFLIAGLLSIIGALAFGIVVQLQVAEPEVRSVGVFDIRSTELAVERLLEDATSQQQAALAVTSELSEVAEMREYLEVIDSCGPHFEGDCVRIRSGVGTSSPVVGSVRNGMVLMTDKKVEVDGEIWHRVVFEEWLRYPERVTSEWYIAGSFVRILENEGIKTLEDDGAGAGSTTKKIVVDRSDQKLIAYDGDEVFMETSISTGLALSPTPRGTFTIYRKTPTRYMQGPLPYIAGSDYYDLPGVPWNLYFTEGGAVIHGAYWHDSFGSQYSHGCVNMEISEAEKLYHWAELGMTVQVRD